MKYFVDLFSPETAEVFANSSRTISGFRISRKSYINNQKLGPGDRFICYVTRIQRFIGVLEVQSEAFVDPTPLFKKDDDPFVLRFKVKTLVWLPFEKAVPIHADEIWTHLSFTRGLGSDSNNWTYMVFSSPRAWPDEDCKLIEKLLFEQAKVQRDYPLDEDDRKKLKKTSIRLSSQKEVNVEVPEAEEPEAPLGSGKKLRDSLAVQALIAKIGESLGFKIWLPQNDRSGVLNNWKPAEGSLLETLPFSFDETTLKTIRNIDILWIRGRTIVRAFEVEDTTSIYSGILRMADLVALLPNLDIQIHIVAPENRREDVFKQISRPVFAVLEKGPLAEICSYISYGSINEIGHKEDLRFMKDSVLDDYAEFKED